MDKNDNTLHLNRHQRRELKRHNKMAKTSANNNRIVRSDKIVYKDDSYIDKTKRVYTEGINFAKERIQKAKEVFKLPLHINTIRRKMRTNVILLNKDGHKHDFMPDYPGRHCLLVHKDIAKKLLSNVCMFVRITDNRDENDNPIDGSWAIVPAEYKMMMTTTIQHLKKRKWFLFHRYWYEISFDGRVQPAHLLFDYDMDPTARRTRLWISNEYVPVRGSENTFNEYFRFWKNKIKKI